MPICNDAWRSKSVRMRPGNHVSPGKHPSELFAEAAIDFLERVDDETPFFAYIAFMAPHDPRVMPERFQEMYDPADVVFARNFRAEHPFDNGAFGHQR